MRKLTILFFIAVMCLSLVSCGNRSQNCENTVISQIEDKTVETENYVAVLRVQINPTFEIYIDENNNVLAVDCINDDAKHALSNVNVVGQNCMDALQVLVTEVIRAEMIENDIVVYITPVYEKDSVSIKDLINDIPDVIEQLQVGISISVEFDDDGIVETHDMDNTVSNDTTDLEETKDDDIEVIRDESGNVQTRYYDEDGHITKETFDCIDGTFEEAYYRENGLLKKSTVNLADGTYQVNEFNENGDLIKQTIEKKDGTITETVLDGSGRLLLKTGKTSDGGELEWTYHSNGEVKEATIRYENGAYNTQTFDEKGIKLTYEGAYVNGNGSIISFKYLYDTNGKETEYYGIDNLGRPIHKIYNSDGTSITYRTENDGSTTTIYYDANGNRINP